MPRPYEQAIAAGIPIDSHYSDLYMKDCKEARAILANYECKESVTSFKSNIDGEMWLDFPFAFDPYWDKVFYNPFAFNPH
jgi:hypothetical protein